LLLMLPLRTYLLLFFTNITGILIDFEAND
jgi:hypothetical protein